MKLSGKGRILIGANTYITGQRNQSTGKKWPPEMGRAAIIRDRRQGASPCLVAESNEGNSPPQESRSATHEKHLKRVADTDEWHHR
jgi:hypothetical protein